MPHYKDGTPAQVGDIVRGKGYNVPHEVVGRVMRVTADKHCNLTVACVTEASQLVGQDAVLASTEYGEAAAFEKIS